jgi:hypothetical protein
MHILRPYFSIRLGIISPNQYSKDSSFYRLADNRPPHIAVVAQVSIDLSAKEGNSSPEQQKTTL